MTSIRGPGRSCYTSKWRKCHLIRENARSHASTRGVDRGATSSTRGVDRQVGPIELAVMLKKQVHLTTQKAAVAHRVRPATTKSSPFSCTSRACTTPQRGVNRRTDPQQASNTRRSPTIDSLRRDFQIPAQTGRPRRLRHLAAAVSVERSSRTRTTRHVTTFVWPALFERNPVAGATALDTHFRALT